MSEESTRQANTWQDIRQRARQKSAKSRYFWGAVVLVVVGLGLWFYFHPIATSGAQKAGRRGDPAGKPMTVGAATATTRDMNVYFQGLGAVTPVATVVVKPRVDGLLVRVLFKEGQHVQQGDVLAEIDSQPFEVALQQAEGQRARDQAQLASAKTDLERYQTLFQQDSIAKQQLDQQAALVQQLEGTLKADEAQIASARLQLGYTKVRAPASGRLGLRQVDPGNMVHSSDSNGLYVITQMQPITVVFTLPEDNLPAVLQQIHAGKTLTVEAYDRAQAVKLASGQLLTVDNQIDTSTGTIKLKAQFANTAENLFPNQFVNVRMRVNTLSGVTVVPRAAVQQGSSGPFLYVVGADQMIAVRPVKLGVAEDDLITLDDGLKPGEVVVVDGVDKLRAGIQVNVATATDKPATAKPEGKHPHGDHHRPDKGDSAKPAAE